MEFVEGTRVAPVDNVRRLMDVAVQIADGMEKLILPEIGHVVRELNR